MSKLRIIILSLFVILLCGCQSKFDGTWCLYNEVPTTLIILKDNVTNEEIKTVTNYLDTLTDKTSYDIIDDIETANKMINVYYSTKDNMDSYKTILEKNPNIKRVDNKMINKANEKIIINGNYFIYGKDLNNLNANEIKGSLKKDGNTIILENDTFYYKDKFLCHDKDCSIIFTKSNNDCN